MSPYLARLRAQVGDDLLLLPSVTVLVRDAHGRLLLVREREMGHWQTIGGMVEPGESPADAARREAMEETGIEVRIERLLTALGGDDYTVTYPNGHRVAYVTSVFEATITSGTPRADGDEVSEIGWFEPSEFASLELDRLNRTLLGALFPTAG